MGDRPDVRAAGIGDEQTRLALFDGFGAVLEGEVLCSHSRPTRLRGRDSNPNFLVQSQASCR